MAEKTYEHGMWLDENRQVVDLDKAEDFDIEINYFVYTLDGNGDKKRLVGSYPCRCVAKDVKEHIWEKHQVECGVYRKVTEDLI